MLALTLSGCTQTYCADVVFVGAEQTKPVMHCWERCLHLVCLSLDDTDNG